MIRKITQVYSWGRGGGKLKARIHLHILQTLVPLTDDTASAMEVTAEQPPDAEPPQVR